MKPLYGSIGRARYLVVALLVLALMALTPDRPPADAVDAWDVELSELMEFAPPGSVLALPATFGIDAEFASYNLSNAAVLNDALDRPGDCYAFMRGGESTVAGVVVWIALDGMSSFPNRPKMLT